MSWPVFGKLAKSVDTIFLNRNQASDIKRVLKEMSSHFSDKEVICIFPEGTSSDGKQILPFKSNLFQAVVDTQIPVTPIFIQYQLHGKFTEVPAYYGDMTLVESILSMLKTPQITAILEVLSEIPPPPSRQLLSAAVYAELHHACPQNM